MTAKEYYKSTRMVETRNWTLEMALNFAEEYTEVLCKQAVVGRSELLLADFVKWQKKYKDSSYVNMFDFKKFLDEASNSH